MRNYFKFKLQHLIFLTSIFLFFCNSSVFASNFMPFSNLFIFGDSLSDIGNRPDAPVTNRNPDGSASLWDNRLAGDLGLGISTSNSGGNDYAQSRAVTGSLPFDPGTNLTLESQLQAYLTSTNGKTDSHALYTVWGGGNDIGDALYFNQIQNPLLTSASTGNILDMVNQLHNAGARYILVPNVPDISQTPLAHLILTTKELQDLAVFMQAYNTQLLTTLNSTGYDVIQADVYGLLSAVIHNFTKFGFIPPYGITCNKLTDVTCGSNPDQNIFFSDGFHPSQASHHILGDYFLSILEGPVLANMLSQTPVSSVQTQHDNIQSNLESLEFDRKKSLVVGQWQFFSTGNYDFSHQSQSKNSTNFYPAYHQRDYSFTAGLEELVNPNWIIGFSVGRATGTVDGTSDSEDFNYDQDINMVNLFSGLNFWKNQAYLNTIVGYGHIIDNRINRNFNLGICPETVYANTSGDDYNIELNTGYYFNLKNHPAIKTGPFVALDYQHVDINAYAEASSQFQTENGAFDALQYQLQDDNFLNTEIGWQWRNNSISYHNILLTPSLQVGYLHKFITNPDVVAGVTTLQGSHYTIPAISPIKNFGVAKAEIDGTFKEGYTVGLGYNLVAARHFVSQGLMIDLTIPLSKIKK